MIVTAHVDDYLPENCDVVSEAIEDAFERPRTDLCVRRAKVAVIVVTARLESVDADIVVVIVDIKAIDGEQIHDNGFVVERRYPLHF